MTFEKRQEGEITIIKVKERRIFLKTADEFKKELMDVIDEGITHMIIDLAEVSVMNSSGLGVLMLARDKIHGREGKLIICGLHSMMAEIFHRMGFDTFFNISHDCESALGDMRK